MKQNELAHRLVTFFFVVDFLVFPSLDAVLGVFAVCLCLRGSVLDHCVVPFWLGSIVVSLRQRRPLYFMHAWANSAAMRILSAGHDFQSADSNDYRVCDVVCFRLRILQRDTFNEGFCFTCLFRLGNGRILCHVYLRGTCVDLDASLLK